jgi:NodT family efflux transporter outer membrane factor (OMF) lipoprotein
MAPIVKHSRFWATAVALTVTAGCVNAPALKPEAIPASPKQLGLAPAADSSTEAVWPATDWWTRFDDAQLSGLIEAARAEQEAARLVLSIAVARAYFQLQERYETLTLAQDTLRQRQAVVQLVESRARNGLDSRAEIDPNAAAAASMRQDIASLEENIASLKHQLAALTGRGPDAAAAITPVPRAAEQSAIAAPLRADLLGRRPDIVAQRLRIESAQSDVAVAKADFYPNIDLRAFFGVQSILLSKLFDPESKTVGAGPAIHLPIFDAGRLRATLGARYAQMDIAVEQYNQTLIDAVREVADQGTSLEAIDRQLAAADESLHFLEKARQIAQARYRKGLASYLAVLNTEGPLLVQRRTIATLHERQREAELGLIKALGGGYTMAPAQVSGG